MRLRGFLSILTTACMFGLGAVLAKERDISLRSSTNASANVIGDKEKKKQQPGVILSFLLGVILSALLCVILSASEESHASSHEILRFTQNDNPSAVYYPN